jgi:MoaA/NifB/PqqE/SkfB family radical SAM enzyme
MDLESAEFLIWCVWLTLALAGKRNQRAEGTLMAIEIADKSFMMIFLLEECNFACPHCVREDEPMDCGYRLSFRQLQSCLADCRALGCIRRVHFSGGETTLWREGALDLVDLLLEIAGAGFTPGFISNGSLFCQYERCYDFFRRYVEVSTVPLRFYLSIDTFHNNFDPETGRARSLDNVLRCKRDLPANTGDLLGEPEVVVVVSKDPASLLPDEMVAHYRSHGVRFGFVPLRYGGKARSMRDLCPELDSDDASALGAYGRYAPEQRPNKPEHDAQRVRADYPILIGDDYYVHIGIGDEHRDNRWRKIAKLGQLSGAIVHGPCDADKT